MNLVALCTSNNPPLQGDKLVNQKVAYQLTDDLR